MPSLQRAASMGPRSGERGNVQRIVASRMPRIRFNGAASGERGNPIGVELIGNLHAASMGPRSGERGNHRHRAGIERTTFGFNGAALR